MGDSFVFLDLQVLVRTSSKICETNIYRPCTLKSICQWKITNKQKQICEGITEQQKRYPGYLRTIALPFKRPFQTCKEQGAARTPSCNPVTLEFGFFLPRVAVIGVCLLWEGLVRWHFLTGSSGPHLGQDHFIFLKLVRMIRYLKHLQTTIGGHLSKLYIKDGIDKDLTW